MNVTKYTYPKALGNRFAWKLWRKVFCRIGFHLWDEVKSGKDHYLFCDACGEAVEIK